MSLFSPDENKTYAEVVLNLSADLCFTYFVPEEIAGRLQVGHRILVPLGSRRINGFITAFPADPPRRPARSIIRLLDPEPFFGNSLISLVRWISRYYFCSFPRAFKTALPSPIRNTKNPSPVLHVALNISEVESVGEIEKLAGKAPRQADILRVMRGRTGTRPLAAVLKESGASRSSLTALEKKGLVIISSEDRYGSGRPGEEILPTGPLKLNDEQRVAFKEIVKAIDNEEFRVFLLHGITGSGKTEIYLQAVVRVLERGEGAIILVPEISLTPQTGERFRSRFGDQVVIIHSAQAAGERYQAWRRIASGEARVVLGPRSAVFAPVKNLGLIVVDEEHETSYKQSSIHPFYHGRDVAVMRGKLEGCPVILGSATPSVESYNNQAEGKYSLLSLHTRPDEAELPTVKIVDMRIEREKFRGGISFSSILLKEMKANLEEGRQTILFLNRRGFFTVLVCRECGYVAHCPHCSISLTYHKSDHRQVCHLCGYTAPPERRCPVCGSKDLTFSGRGTQRIEEQVKKIFPQARVRRMDSDAVTARDSHRIILDEFKTGKIDILLGTQMIARGLDFPNVTLVGVIMADTALSLADFRATEYTFQILTQVAGRAGRGELPGKVIIQTFLPNHPALRSAVRQDYLSFFNQEIALRAELGYPPINHFISLTVLSRNEDKSLRVCEHLARLLKPVMAPEDEILGPAPPPIPRIRGRYRWQLLLKTHGVVSTLNALRLVLPGLGKDRDVKIEVDVDPISML
ncbi:MAG: primosomal protein N' [Candidatus Auribacterota bacterium]|nr:primosomal protein N' [Candidatus Auribacterota bacterium]